MACRADKRLMCFGRPFAFCCSDSCGVCVLLVQSQCCTDVRYWHKADIPFATPNVCFRGQSGHRLGDNLWQLALEPMGPLHVVPITCEGNECVLHTSRSSQSVSPVLRLQCRRRIQIQTNPYTALAVPRRRKRKARSSRKAGQARSRQALVVHPPRAHKASLRPECSPRRKVPRRPLSHQTNSVGALLKIFRGQRVFKRPLDVTTSAIGT